MDLTVAATVGFRFKVLVVNVGPMAAAAVVLAFISPLDIFTDAGAAASSINSPNTSGTFGRGARQRLACFDRVWLAPGEQATVALTALPRSLATIDDAGVRWVRAGRFRLTVGDVIDPTALEVVVGVSTSSPIRVD